MRRFPSMKVGLASILSCLALLLGMFATTGTASAQTATIHPFINVSSFSRFGDCVSFQLTGGDFTPNHHVDLSASGGASISPGRVRADSNGNFSVLATVCGNRAFESCGEFIEGPNFCGFNLPQQDFCGLPGFPTFQSCVIGSAMKALQGCPNGMMSCIQPPPTFCQQPGQLSNPKCHRPHGSMGPSGNNGGQPGCQPGQTCCQPFSNLPQCRNQGGHFPHHPQFQFHRVSVFDFCRRHFHQNFPFCFRSFPQEFAISFRITAKDEHTGHRAHAFISIG